MNSTDNPKKYDDAWLGLGDLSKIEISDNPMVNRSEYDIEHPDLHLLRLIANPRNLGSTCKILFGI